MPEIAEAAAIADAIDKKLNGWILTEITIDPDSEFYPEIPGMDLLNNAVKLDYSTSLGKKVIFSLSPIIDDSKVSNTSNNDEKNIFFIAGGGMSGIWLFKPDKFSRIKFTFVNKSDINENIDLYFSNKRKATAQLRFYNKSDMEEYLDLFGPDPNRDKLTIDQWISAIGYPKKRVILANLLKDQKVIHGLGNYMRAEISYRAGINPKTKLNELSRKKVEKLIENMLLITQEAVKAKGLSISDYFLPDGSEGSFEPKIYGRRETDDGYKIETFKSGGQTMYWVPEKQK